MSDTNSLLDAANALGRQRDLPYAGALSPQDAHAVLQANADVKLIDVRTQAERDWVGRVDISASQHLAIQWTLYPGGIANPNFLHDLQAQVPDKATPILFLCRSGVRSRHAATLATEHGYTHCYDILEGFEGDKDQQGHRKTTGGWCKAGLPWQGA